MSSKFLSKKVFHHEGTYFIPTDVLGDGNCFFRSLCVDASFKGLDHLQLQSQLISRVTRKLNTNKGTNIDLLLQNLVTRYLKSSFNDYSESTPTVYFKRISQANEWGGIFESMLITLLFGVDIITVETWPSGPLFISSKNTINSFVKDAPDIPTTSSIYIYFHQINNPLQLT